MQNVEVYRLTKILLALLCCSLLWLSPATHGFLAYCDQKLAIAINQTLPYSRSWQMFWAYLNHRHETWLNVVFMVGLNFLGVFNLEKSQRAKAALRVAYFWLFFQLIIILTELVFSKMLIIQRSSPSLVITPWHCLADMVNMKNIKVYSYNCFPAGHVLVLVFWARFSMFLFSNKLIRAATMIGAIILTLPRLFSGAHWVSDIIFTSIYSLMWADLAIISVKAITNFRAQQREERIH